MEYPHRKNLNWKYLGQGIQKLQQVKQIDITPSIYNLKFEQDILVNFENNIALRQKIRKILKNGIELQQQTIFMSILMLYDFDSVRREIKQFIYTQFIQSQKYTNQQIYIRDKIASNLIFQNIENKLVFREEFMIFLYEILTVVSIKNDDDVSQDIKQICTDLYNQLQKTPYSYIYNENFDSLQKSLETLTDIDITITQVGGIIYSPYTIIFQQTNNILMNYYSLFNYSQSEELLELLQKIGIKILQIIQNFVNDIDNQQVSVQYLQTNRPKQMKVFD